MQIARIEKERSVAEIVARLYNLKPDDPRTAAVGKALIAANPHLSNLASLPAGTPVTVPQVPGLSVQSSAVADPRRATRMYVLEKLFDSAQEASNAQATGLGSTPPKTPDAHRTQALALLRNDIARFKKLHGGW